MSIIRGGIANIVRGTAPSDAGAPFATLQAARAAGAEALMACGNFTFNVRLKNTGAADLFVFARQSDVIGTTLSSRFITLVPDEILEGLFEFEEMFLLGDGATTTYELLYGRRGP